LLDLGGAVVVGLEAAVIVMSLIWRAAVADEVATLEIRGSFEFVELVESGIAGAKTIVVLGGVGLMVICRVEVPGSELDTDVVVVLDSSGWLKNPVTVDVSFGGTVVAVIDDESVLVVAGGNVVVVGDGVVEVLLGVSGEESESLSSSSCGSRMATIK
jgi:hypothetical protein